MSIERQRVDFEIAQFRDLINQKGYNLVHEKAVMCTCYNSDGTPKADCEICEGYGWRYFEVGSVQGILTGITKDTDIQQYGIMPNGIVNITVLPDVRLSFRDRMILIDGRMVYSEFKFDNFDQTVQLRYPVVDVEIISDIAKQYVKHTDFEVVDKKIRWLDAQHIPIRFSVRYITYPRFIIMNFPNLIRATQVKFKKTAVQSTELPVRAIAKLEFMIQDGELQ